MSTYIHNIPGRLRIKIPELIRNKLEKDKLICDLNRLNGIKSIKTNDLTGSIIINYNVKLLTPWELLTTFKINPYFCKTLENKSDNRFGRALYGWAIGELFDHSALSLLVSLI